MPWDEWKRAVEIDLHGVVLPCRAFIPGMKARGVGKIINLSGGGATGPRPFFSAYAAAKTAVVRVTEILAEELRSFQIDVNAIAPGRDSYAPAGGRPGSRSGKDRAAGA